MVPSALQRPPIGIPKLSVASLVDVKSTLWARSGGRSPEGALACVGVGGSESKMQSESWSVGNGKRFGGEFLFRADGVAHEVGIIGRVIVQIVVIVVEVVVCGGVVRDL